MIEEVLTSKASESRRVMMIRLDARIFPDMFRQGLFIECTKGLPKETEVVSVHTNHELRIIEIVIRNDEFEPVPFGELLPSFYPELRGYHGKELGTMRRIIGSVKGLSEESAPIPAPDFSRIKKEWENRYKPKSPFDNYTLAAILLVAFLLGVIFLR